MTGEADRQRGERKVTDAGRELREGAGINFFQSRLLWPMFKKHSVEQNGTYAKVIWRKSIPELSELQAERGTFSKEHHMAMRESGCEDSTIF